jgi:hypothetical protein
MYVRITNVFSIEMEQQNISDLIQNIEICPLNFEDFPTDKFEELIQSLFLIMNNNRWCIPDPLLDDLFKSTFISARELTTPQRIHTSIKYMNCLIDVYKERVNNRFALCIQEFLNTFVDGYSR